MTDIVQAGAMLGDIAGDRRASPGEPAGGRREQAGQKPQQARLATAVGSGQHQRAARRQAEREPGEDQALAATACEVLGDQIGSGYRNWGQSRFPSPKSTLTRVSANFCKSTLTPISQFLQFLRKSTRPALRAVPGRGTKKAAPEGEIRSRGPSVEWLDRSTRFGGQTCKAEPYTYNMGSGLGLLFEESVTI